MSTSDPGGHLIQSRCGPTGGRQITLTQLQQVFANLAVNALQAMSGQGEGRLLIRTALIDARTVCALIEDNGPGISEDQLHRLFQSFFTTKKGGMGIGLAICRSIVEAHGGRLDAANQSGGRGALFRFTLPALPDTHSGRSS